MLTSHEKLIGHIKTNFQLTFHHKYSQSDLDKMLPWERLVLIDLIQDYIKAEDARKRNEINAKKDIQRAFKSLAR